MRTHIVPYQVSLKLKSLGFDVPTLYGYDTLGSLYYSGDNVFHYTDYNKMESGFNVSAPLYAQVFHWFKMKYGFYADLFVDDDKTFGYLISYFTDDARICKPIFRGFNTYEESELDCVLRLIEIVKKK